MQKEGALRIWFDTEFIDDGHTIELLSIGLIREDGRTYYAEPAEADRSRACPWVREHVLPHLAGPMKPRAVIAAEIKAFARGEPEFWAYYGAYDWVCLCQLYGRMIDAPEGWPMLFREVRTLYPQGFAPPAQQSTEHHALNDAIWTKDVWELLHAPAR
jgi:hypothetical protein